MRSRSLWLVILLIGCGEGVPPLDELPLRDALRAEPEVVASLPTAARQRLAARLEAARTGDSTSDRLGDDDPAAPAAAPAARVIALDRTRERRLAESLVVGEIAADIARPVLDRPPTGDPALPPLPMVEGESAVATASLEARALEGDAGTSVRTLLGRSGAGHLRRVVGWPVGAIAIGDTVYVNASWLVALAPGDSSGADGGVDGAPPSLHPAAGAAPEGSGPIASAANDAGLPSVSNAVAEQASSLRDLNPTAAATGGQGIDAGAPSPAPPPSSGGPSFWDACGAGADTCGAAGDSCSSTTDDGSSCSSTTDDGSSDSCSGTTDDGSSDSCSGTTDDGSADSCSTPPDDGGGCQVARGGRRSHFGTLLWLLAPLGFLLGRRP